MAILLIKKGIVYTADDHQYFPWHIAALFDSKEVMSCFTQLVNVRDDLISGRLIISDSNYQQQFSDPRQTRASVFKLYYIMCVLKRTF